MKFDLKQQFSIIFLYPYTNGKGIDERVIFGIVQFSFAHR